MLLHACAHNPTGVDPSAAEWAVRLLWHHLGPVSHAVLDLCPPAVCCALLCDHSHRLLISGDWCLQSDILSKLGLQVLADIFVAKKLVPLFDSAYTDFGILLGVHPPSLADFSALRHRTRAVWDTLLRVHLVPKLVRG